ncbi:MAG TPA: restriction endonuclease subunit S [Thermoanaerobaculia bacterium]|jgi:type I restriction enzyme S subunit
MSEHDTNLPRGWAMATVARVGSVRLGRQRSPDKQTGRFSTKYLRAANITTKGLDLSDVLEMDFTPDERELFGLRSGDIVLAEASGSATHVGRAAIWRDEIPGCCYQNTVIRFRPYAAEPGFALLLFLYYAASGVFARTARGIGIQHLGASRFAELPFPLPPFAEQRRIADEAERRLAEIRKAKASLRSALDRIAQQDREILAAAVAGKLVEPEAILAERQGRGFQDVPSFVVQSETTGSEQGWLFNSDKEGGTQEWPPRKLPPGWKWARVGDLGEARLGKQLSPKEKRGPKQRPYLRVANVFEDHIDTSDVKWMHFSDEEFDAYQLKPGDLLLNEGQSLELAGRPAMYRGEVPEACFQNTLIRFRCTPWVDPEYALIVFRHYLHAGEFRKIARWSTNIAHLGLKRFGAMAFPLPPLAEQRRIAAEARRRLEASREQAEAVRASIARLSEMESELLAAVITGKLVPQDETDEPAAALLDRLGSPPAESPPPQHRPSVAKGEILMKETRRSGDHRTVPAAVLAEVLREASRPLRLPELFSMAGYNRDSTEQVEQFYLALRTELGRSIRQVGDVSENVVLELIDDAS